MQIHPTAVVDTGAELADDVEVGPLAVIEGGTVIGPGCRIGPHAVILRHTVLGPGCRVHAHAILGDLPQDLAYRDAPSRVVIGARSVIREGVTIHRGTKENTETVVGEDCLLMANSHLAHNVRLGNRVILANGVLLAGYVTVGDGAFLSGNAMVHQFCRVGRLAMMSGGSGASCDVPPFCTTRSISMNTLLGLNTVGLRRAGLDSPTRLALRHAYHALFFSPRPLAESAAELRPTAMGPVAEFLDFITTAKRGITRPGCRSPVDDDESNRGNNS